MLQGRPDKDGGLVSIAAVTTESEKSCCTVESMQKISREEEESLIISLRTEWSAAMEPQADTQFVESRNQEQYWTQRSRKVRRILSEALSPKA